MLELISTVSDGLQIVKAFTDDQKSGSPRLDRLDDEIVDALRSIYFVPQGVLTLLEEVAEGRQPDAQQVEVVLPRFNDGEWRVGRALAVLEFDDLSGNREISLRRARTLDLLRYGKIHLRRDIQELLNHSLTFGRPISPEAARALLERVHALNAEIESLEEAHNYRARR